MIQTVEAVVDGQGRVRLLGPVQVDGLRRALVTVLDEPATVPGEAALLAEAALAADWNRPEEDAAWSHLQPEKESSSRSHSQTCRNPRCDRPSAWPTLGEVTGSYPRSRVALTATRRPCRWTHRTSCRVGFWWRVSPVQGSCSRPMPGSSCGRWVGS